MTSRIADTLRVRPWFCAPWSAALLLGCTADIGEPSDAATESPDNESAFGSGGVTEGAGGSPTSGGVTSAGGTGGPPVVPAGGTPGVGGQPTGGSEGTGGSTPTGTEPFKGIAGASPCEDLSRVGATWFYTWGSGTNCSPGNDIEFVPMIWGAGAIDQAAGTASSGATHLLGFNEPERGDQANMSVGDSIALWPQLESTGLRLGSPATASSPDGEEWLSDFMSQADAQGRRVDFIAVHWYGWGGEGCDNINAHFTGYMERMMSYGLPVWITEWGCYGESETDARAFYNAAVAWLIARAQVERYGWFLTRAGENGSDWNAQNLVNGDGSLTALGTDYLASQARR